MAQKRSAAALERRYKKNIARMQARLAALQASPLNLAQAARPDITNDLSTPNIQLKLPNPMAAIRIPADEAAWETWPNSVLKGHGPSPDPDTHDHNCEPLTTLVQSSDRVTVERITHTRMVLYKENRPPSTAKPLVSKPALPPGFQRAGFTETSTKSATSHHDLLARESIDKEAQSRAITNPIPTFEKIHQFLDAFNRTSGAPPLALVVREMAASVSKRPSTPISKLTIAATEHSPPLPRPQRSRLTSSLPIFGSPVVPKLRDASSPLSASIPRRAPSPWLGLPYTPQISFSIIDTTEDKDEPTESKPPLQPHEIIEISDDEESIQLKPTPHKFRRRVRYHDC